VAPGTFGSLVGLPVAWGARQFPFGWQLAFAAAFFLLGIPVCRRAAELLHAKDPGAVVFDEIAAFPVLFLFAPFTWRSAIAGFVLFRLFDITKPSPCRRLERLPGGWGIMADDLIAGLYAGGALWCIARWLPLV